MNKKVDNVCHFDNTSKSIFKGIKLYLILLSLIISKNEISSYIDRQNLSPKVKLIIHDKKDLLPKNGFCVEPEIYSSIKKYECEKVVEKYGNIYGIKKDVIMNIIGENSKNFQSYEFQNRRDIFSIGKSYDNYDLQVLLLVHDLYAKPYNYGYEYKDIKCDSNTEDISEMTIREYIYEISEVLGMDKDTTLAIACAESYYFEAPIATSNNNPFAMNSSNGFIKYENLYLGITEGLINLRYNYDSLDINLIASRYCPSEPFHWVNLVYGCMNNLEKGCKLYDEVNNELVLK